MKRRDFVALVAGAIASPFPAQAQPLAAKERLGALILYAADTPSSSEVREVLERSLASRGWKVGQNLEIDYRYGIAQPEIARKAVADLIALKPDLILANSVSATRAATEATRDIPIVFNAVSEPISLGFVTSLSHPGRNVTGFTNLEPSVGGKWLELLKAIAPQTARVAVMYNPTSTKIASQFVAAIASAAPHYNLAIREAPVQTAADIDAAMEAIGKEPNGSLVTLPDTFLAVHFRQIVDLEKSWRVPAIHPFRYFTDAGSLMSYGPDLVDQFREVAPYIDRIFRGEKVGDLPVQQPTKFTLIINQKAAKNLTLAVPSTLLATADEVIE